jgi:hypothetical protein
VMLDAPDWETVRVVHMVRRLYQPREEALSPAQKHALSARILMGYLAHRDDPTLASLRPKIEVYNDELDRLRCSSPPPTHTHRQHLQHHTLRHMLPVSFDVACCGSWVMMAGGVLWCCAWWAVNNCEGPDPMFAVPRPKIKACTGDLDTV